MQKAIYALLSIAFFLKASSCKAQENGFKNLSDYVSENKLFDYGYGLDHYESRLDSIVCFNDIMDKAILYRDIQSLRFSSNDSTFTIATKGRKGALQSIDILHKGKVISKHELNDTVSHLNFVAKSYRIRFDGRNYTILYLTDEYMMQHTFQAQFLGVLIDEEKKTICPFPRLQSTNSLLNITDLDNNQKLDVVCYNPAYTNKVEVFELQNTAWVQNEKYTCILKSTDNFVWQIDFGTDNFLKAHYRK